ncbi:hypothetical protein MNBD_NITROSPINAE01-644 [hydrothermal vent metagenome]|uniref:Periplasmic heavy metal sensor n=1 Tax=hydrothermal vent metagenome TaxID=652676 RepID=A0A3B1BPW7_9ZZZZ
MRKLLIVVIVLGMFPITAVARDYDKDQKRGKHRQDYIKELGLSDEQVDAIRLARKEMRRDAIRIRADLELKQLDFEDELQSENPDSKTLDKLINELAEFKAEQEKQRLAMIVKMVEVLTPEQKAKFLEKMMKRMMMGNQKGGKGRHGK